ncbi:MAG: M1 family metallopeptidase, partial [bacterium]|nr:M1 family metallopeptidase [bacterium]
QEIFRGWQERPERRLLGVETAILGDALGDPFYGSYFAGWFRGEELGEFLYLFEPEAREQITLGQFVTLDATAKEKRKLARQLDRAQRKGRLIGLSVEDLGQWDTWLSASLTDKDGKPTPAARAFEPQRYVLDLSLSDSKLELQGRARLDLRAVSSVGRVVKLDIHPDLAVQRVRTEDGRELFFHQSRGDILVVLPQAPEQNETLAIELEYSGHLIDKDSKTWTLRSTTHWYPHAGTFDLATYDVTFHWPEKMDLMAGGQRVDGGVEDGGRRFERRRLDHPTFGFSFEVGKFRTLTGTAGHVSVTLALDPLAQSLVDKDSRKELLAAVIDSVVYFEEIFGPYPLDELVVATALREYSQSFLGLVTLSNLSISETNLLTFILGLEDRRTIVAHEIAHQWWGHMVAWQSYRDQWISEAMANYAAVLYARNRLKGEGEPLLI